MPIVIRIALHAGHGLPPKRLWRGLYLRISLFRYRKTDFCRKGQISVIRYNDRGMFPPFRWMMHRKRGLRGWIVSILASAPKNGAEIMDEIETMTQGWWRPSPGSVYPLLEQMTQEDLLRKRDDGRYELSPKAKEEIEWPFGMPGRKAQTVEDMVNEIVGFVSYLEDLARSDRSKLAPFREKIKNVSDRLAALVSLGKP